MADCTVDFATSEEAFTIAKAEAEIAKIRVPLLEQMLTLSENSPPNSTKPLIETMSPSDLIKFTEIRSKLVFTSAQDYLESEHARDIHAIQTLWHIIMNRMDGKPHPPLDSNGSILSGVIGAVDEKLADQPITLTVPENSTSCDLPMAVSIAESKLVEINNQQTKITNSALAWINGLTAKHPEIQGKMNFAQLTIAEQTQYKKLVQDVLKPAIDRQQAVKDSEYLKIMYRLSAERTTDGKADLAKSGGDTKAIGSTFKGKARDSVTQILINAMFFIGDKIPSQATILDQQLIK